MDVRSDTQIQDQEWTHPRINKSGAGFRKDHREKIWTGTGTWWGEMWKTYWGKCWGRIYQGKGREDDWKQDGKDACQRDLKSTGLRAGEETDRGDVEKKDHQLYRRPYMMGKARGKVSSVDNASDAWTPFPWWRFTPSPNSTATRIHHPWNYTTRWPSKCWRRSQLSAQRHPKCKAKMWC